MSDTDTHTAKTIIDRLHEELSIFKAVSLNGLIISMSAPFGPFALEADAGPVDWAIEKADKALSASNNESRNIVSIWNSTMQKLASFPLMHLYW